MNQWLNIFGSKGWFGTGPQAPRFWCLLGVLLGVLGFCKGIRLPNYWSASQAQVDYRFGIVKRGLFGAAVSRPLHLEHYSRFAVVSFALLAITAIVFVLYVARSGIFRAVGEGEAAALFLASFAIPCVVNLIGYFDIVLFGVTLALLLVRSPHLRFGLAIPASALALMVHESFLMLFVPVLLFSFFLDAAGGRSKPRTAWMYATTLGVLCVATTLLLARGASLSPAKTNLLMHEVAAQADFTVRPDFFKVMQRSFGDNVQLMLRKVLEPLQMEEQLSGIIVFLPLLLLLLIYIRQVCRQSLDLWLRKRGFAVACCVAVVPLLMQVLGWDVFRWDAWSCVAAFLALTLLVRVQPSLHVAVSPRLRNATLFVMLLNAGTGEGLLDVPPNQYPFLQELSSTLTRLHHQGLKPATMM